MVAVQESFFGFVIKLCLLQAALKSIGWTSQGAVQLLRNAPGGGGGGRVWHFVTGGGGGVRPSVT